VVVTAAPAPVWILEIGINCNLKLTSYILLSKSILADYSIGGLYFKSRVFGHRNRKKQQVVREACTGAIAGPHDPIGGAPEVLRSGDGIYRDINF
jgi:hypothetical protein